MSKDINHPELTDAELHEMNRWSRDSGKLTQVAAEVVLSIVGIHKSQIDALYYDSLVNAMIMPIGGAELGTRGLSSIREGAVPDRFIRFAHPEFMVYVDQQRQPVKQRPSIINDPGFYQVIVRSQDQSWRHHFMHFDFYPHTGELYMEKIAGHKRLIEMGKKRK